MTDIPVDADHDGPWMSCMRRDGRLMYRNRNVPATVEINGVTANVDDILLHHELPEWDDIQRRLERLGREPTAKERKAIYLNAHAIAGTPSERAYVKSQGIDWSAWSAWCRGQEAKVERGPFTNEPTDADVKPIPHGHGELEVSDAFNENQPRDEHGRWTSGEAGYVVAERDREDKIRIYGVHKDQDRAAQLAAQRKSDNEDEDSYSANPGAHVSVHRTEISGQPKGDLYVVATGARDDDSLQVHGAYADRGAAQRAQDETLRQRWENGEGRELDWDHPIMEREWDKQVPIWNAAHPDKAIGDTYTFGTYPEFEAPLREKMDGVTEPYPGPKAANDYFSGDGTHTQIIRVRTGNKVSDAAITDANDPTGTGDLRKRFMRASDKRWQHAIRLVREAVGEGDLLGLASPNLNSIALRAKHGGVAGADKTSGFHAWLESIIRDVVAGHDGSWMTPFIAEAERAAAARSRGIGALSVPPDHDHSPHRALAVSELRGLASVAVQQGTRAAAAAISKRSRPAVAARSISQALDGAMKRARLMADYLVSKAFTAATVAHFRASGIGKVGIVPEHYGAKKGGMVRRRVRDARKRRREVDLDIVQVITAGDDAVCEDCEDASDAGPYTLDEASDLVPLHPRCRCALIPAFDARFAHSELS